jgi:putative membrane protein insertion efficiency factor
MIAALRLLPRRAATMILTAPIHLYRYALSPLLPPRCRFAPSCSAYALEAIALHGPLRGSLLALRRLSRCHPISWLGGGSGYDPVPGHRH